MESDRLMFQSGWDNFLQGTRSNWRGASLKRLGIHASAFAKDCDFRNRSSAVKVSQPLGELDER
jgi:hypothetical protein